MWGKCAVFTGGCVAPIFRAAQSPAQQQSRQRSFGVLVLSATPEMKIKRLNCTLALILCACASAPSASASQPTLSPAQMCAPSAAHGSLAGTSEGGSIPNATSHGNMACEKTQTPKGGLSACWARFIAKFKMRGCCGSGGEGSMGEGKKWSPWGAAPPPRCNTVTPTLNQHLRPCDLDKKRSKSGCCAMARLCSFFSKQKQ